MADPRAGSLPPMPQPGPIEELFGTSVLPGEANAALVWQRYLPCWERDRSRPLEKGKEGPLLLFARAFNERGAGSSHGKTLADAHRRLDDAGLVAEHVEATTPLIIGIGAAHPLDINLTFDPVLGVPAIPGSALKGLCRAFAESEEPGTVDVSRMFGGPIPQKAGGDASPTTGDVVFLDALPVGWPRLKVEVMTPHHSAYNVLHARWLESPPDKRGTAPIPGDWESPVPVPFLTVAERTRFALRLTTRSGDAALRQIALKLLKQALQDLGIGAKTAVGFGVLNEVSGRGGAAR